MLFEVTALVKVNINVAAESHPSLLIRLAVCEPAPLNINPFQVYGKSDGQILILVVLVDMFLTVSINVAAESHP